MRPGYETLTDKEKATLRLLLGGHDAKSVARHLGLSVHTVNERLRDARRKLAVSSSREAARMLREAEEADPQLLGDKGFGEAPASKDGPPPAAPLPARRHWRRTGWAFGGVIMFIALALLAVTSLTDHAAVLPPSPATSAQAGESEPVQAARRWLELGDRSDWSASYAATGASFRSLNTLDNWQRAAISVRVPLGPVVARQLVAEVDTPTPPSGNMVVKFRTDFANKSEVMETVALVREGGGWHVVGIYVE